MKNFILVFIVLLFYSCENKSPINNNNPDNDVNQTEQQSNVDRILVGDHKVNNITEENSLVKFMWETNDKQWVNTQLPIEKVRFQYENVEHPYVKFEWESGESSTSIDEIMNRYLITAIIVTNETN